MKKKALTYSVVIPTLNEEHYVPDLLDDLAVQKLAPQEVIVIDAGSSDATQQVVQEFPDVQFVQSHPPVGAQRDVGGRMTDVSSEWLVFLDADVRLKPHTLQRLLQQAEHLQLNVVCPRYQTYDSLWHIYIWHEVMNMLLWWAQWKFPTGAGPCIAVRRTHFHEIGGFKPEFLCDDAEFVRRAAQLGKFRIVPVTVKISDRRYRKYGFWPTVWQYLRMGWWFTRGNFAACNQLDYRFGEHDPKASPPPSL